MLSAYYLHHQWTHWLFALASPSSRYESSSSFEPYEDDSDYLLRRLNNNPVVHLVHTLSPWYATSHGIQHPTRSAYFTVVGQIISHDMTWDSFPARHPHAHTHIITSVSFWLEARPDPASRSEWRDVLAGLQSLVRLVGQPVDTSNFFVAAPGMVRLRVHGTYRTRVGQPGFPLLDIDGERIIMTERNMIPLKTAVRAVFRVECEQQYEMLSMSAPLTYLGLV